MADCSKKSRKSNFSPEEVDILVKTVGKNYDILYGEYSKRAIYKDARHQAWQDVTNEVNQVSIEKRTLQEVKNKWKKCQHFYRGEDLLDISDEYDSMPLEQRLKSPVLPSTSEQEQILHSHPLSPTKLKVTRQTKPKDLSPKPLSPPPMEEICLKWNSHHGNMQSMFPALLLKEQYVDATLVADGQTLKCHRMILSSCSPYFEEVLCNISPYQHPVLFMKDTPFWILKSLCDFMYTGEVLIAQDKLNELLSAAENLKIKGLAGNNGHNEDFLKEPMFKHIKEESEEAIIEKDSEKKDLPKDKKRHHQSTTSMTNIIPENPPPKVSRTHKTNETPPAKTSKIPKLNTFTDSAVRNTSRPSKFHTSQIESIPIKSSSPKFLRSSTAIKKIERTDKLLIKEAISKGDILDPFDLLEPVYEEVQKEPKPAAITNKAKEVSKSVSIKRNIQKKVKKRKISDDRDESPPPVLSRKGTRSRPNKKIPRFYHSGFDNSTPKIQESPETTIVREPHTSQAESHTLSHSNQEDIHTDHVEIHTEHSDSNIEQTDPLFQLADIKAEPFDADESAIEIEDNIVDFCEPVPSINEEVLLEDNFESVTNFEEKTVSEKPEETIPFKKIRVKRQKVLLDVEKNSMVKIVDVDKIKVSADVLEEDPLTLTSNLDSNIKIMNIESINDNVATISQNKNLSADNHDGSFKLCTLDEHLEQPKEPDENPLGFQIASIVSETEKAEPEDKPLPVCHIAEVFSETEITQNNLDKIDHSENYPNFLLGEANSEKNREKTEECRLNTDTKFDKVLRSEKTFEMSSVTGKCSEGLDCRGNNYQDMEKYGNIDDNDDLNISISVIENTEVSENPKGCNGPGDSSSGQGETNDQHELVTNQVKNSLNPNKSDCYNENDGNSEKYFGSIEEIAEQRNKINTDLEKVEDVLSKTLEEVNEKENLNKAVDGPCPNDTVIIEPDIVNECDNKIVNTFERSSPNTSGSITHPSEKNMFFPEQTGKDIHIGCDRPIEDHQTILSNSSFEIKPGISTNAADPNSKLVVAFEDGIITNELANTEDIDMSADETRTKDPVLANAVPYTNEDLPIPPTQSDILAMEVCEESLSQGAASFDQTSTSFELVTDVAQPAYRTPGFHITQVISEQIALNEECRLTNLPMDTSDACFEGAGAGTNELEMIVNDLTKIVGESQTVESNNMEHEDIAESLENLLEK